MAITIIDQPYKWAVRGQKLMIIASSDEVANTGFRFGVEVVIDGKAYNFYLQPAPDDNMYFDLQSLIDDMRNDEALAYHFTTDDTYDDLSRLSISFTLSEYWLVTGILTLNAGSEEIGESMIAINGYFQVTDGYKPNVLTGGVNIRYTMQNGASYAMSDRKQTTSPFYLSDTWGFSGGTNNIWIPVFEEDYGMLLIPGNNTYLTGNVDVDKIVIVMHNSTGATTTQDILLNGYDVEGLPVYPGNLNDWAGLTVKPNLFANWRCYTVTIKRNDNLVTKSETYIFYNAYRYGQNDCHNDRVRLGWVNSRGGWDYFNFIKKSETSDEIERKKFKKVLFNGTVDVFEANARGLQERRNIVQQIITITTDYITEGEFLFLRSLLVSNQVCMLNDDKNNPLATPVNLDDTTYVEKKTRDGKLYNLTLKIRMANNYTT